MHSQDKRDGGLGDFVPVDLHVHTPASRCYRGDRNSGDAGYLELVGGFHEAGVRVLAITDHNTLAGYRAIMRIRQDIETRLSIVSDLASTHEDMAVAHGHLEQTLGIFESMLILPGIELDAKPGVHVLALFDPSSQLERIDQLLAEAGFPPERQGAEDAEWAAMSVDDLLDAIAGAGGISILAHVDRDKGAFNVLKGAYRAKVLRRDSLHGIAYCDPVFEAKLSEIFTQKDYARAKPIPFFRCSDYHGEGPVGQRVTFMQMESISFGSFRDVFREPVGRVSQTANPKLADMLRLMAERADTVCLPTIESWRDGSAAQAACALLNERGGGRLLLGVGNENRVSVTGISAPKEELREAVTEFLADVRPAAHPKLRFFRYGDRLVVMVPLERGGSTRLHYLVSTRQAWIMDDGRPRCADAPDIAALVEENVVSKIGAIQRQAIIQVQRVAAQATVLERSHQLLRIATKVEEASSELLLDRFRGRLVPRETKNGVSALTPEAASVQRNGVSGGRYLVPHDEPFRLPYAYLRLTIPSFNDGHFESRSDAPLKMDGAFLAIVPSGGVYLYPGETEVDVHLVDPVPHLALLQSRREVQGWELGRTGLWMKSAVATAYVLTSGDQRYSPAMPYWGEDATALYPRLPLPDALFGSQGDALDDIAVRIMACENEFLDLADSDRPDTPVAHNLTVDQLARDAEKLFAEVLGLDEDDCETVDEFLRSRGLYVLDGVDAATGTAIK